MALPASQPRRRAHRGGRGGFEPRAVVRAREARVVELSTEGRSQRSIAAEVGVTQAAVCRILQRADDRVLGTLHRDRIRLLAKVHRRTEHVYAEAHAGWTPQLRRPATTDAARDEHGARNGARAIHGGGRRRIATG